MHINARTPVRLRRALAPAAAIVGIAAVVAVVVVPLSLRRGNEPAPAAAEPGGEPQGAFAALPTDHGAGLPVEGMGTLLRATDGPIRLCAHVVATMDLPTSGAGCGQVAVVTTGVDPAVLVHSTTSGQAYSDPVRVEGTYHDATLAVSRVVPARPDVAPAGVEPEVPCAAPAGGWRLGYGLAGQDDGSASTRLFDFVRAHPDRYNDVWEGHPDGPPAEGSNAATRMVYVVGTTGDVAQARDELSRLYPGNLCVHKVRHAAADLERITGELLAVTATPIEAHPDVIENRVRVKVVALDPPTGAILDGIGRDALLLEEPLLQWLD